MKNVTSMESFTLAERLVVIAILAILVAIAVPIFGGALENAKTTAQDSNCRALRSAGMVYLLTDEGASIRTLGTGKAGWKVDGKVAKDGTLSDVKVEQATTIGTDTKPDGKVEGDYTVYLKPTDLG